MTSVTPSPHLSVSSWIYLFAKFTPEALLFEALLIFILLSGYTAFWILKKRKYGPIDNALPSGPVREYLNELIDNAEMLRSQLFGLLAAGDPRRSEPRLFPMELPAGISAHADEAPAGGDKALLKKLKSMESKMADQAQSMEKILDEKKKLEETLKKAKSEAKAASGASSDGNSEKDAEDARKTQELEKKIAQLEARLNEYNVIEDDLANLKRLQQENAKLKTLLQEKGVPVAEAAPAPAAAPAAAAAPAPAPATAPAALAPATPASSSSGENLFDGLVNQVEQSLQPDADEPSAEASEPAPVSATEDLAAALAAEVTAPAAGAAAPAGATAAAAPEPSAAPAASADGAASTSAPAEATMGTDDDALVAEFEKMLKG